MICEVCNKKTKKNTICSTCYTSLKRYAIKDELIKYKGNKCQKCGYNKCSRSLVFHHKNPDEKDFNISGAHGRSLEKLKMEVDKCDLLCHNCHNEVHAQIELDKNNHFRLRWEHYNQNKIIYSQNIIKNKEKICLKCNKLFIANKLKQVFCSRKCSGRATKLSEDLIEIIKKLVLEKTIHDISIDYNVSPSCVSSFCKKHNIEVKSSKYWNQTRKINSICKNCKQSFYPESNGSRQKYCSITCRDSAISRSPSKEELQALIWQKPTTHIAKQFGVSDKAVEKWCKKYEINKPPRGYWTKRSKL